jgi:hypothetical protein
MVLAGHLNAFIGGIIGFPEPSFRAEPIFKQKIAGRSRLNESTLFNRFINTVLEDWGQTHLLFASRLFVYLNF